MHIELINDGTEVTLVVTDIGNVSIKVPKAYVREAVRRATRAQMAGDTDLSVAGFFDDVGKGLAFFKHQILDNPLVRGVISAIPYGGTVLSVADLAESAVKLGGMAMAAQPPKVRQTVAAAAIGHPAAAQKINAMHLAARAGNPAAQRDAQAVSINAQLLLALKELTALREQLKSHDA